MAGNCHDGHAQGAYEHVAGRRNCAHQPACTVTRRARGHQWPLRHVRIPQPHHRARRQHVAFRLLGCTGRVTRPPEFGLDCPDIHLAPLLSAYPAHPPRTVADRVTCGSRGADETSNGAYIRRTAAQRCRAVHTMSDSGPRRLRQPCPRVDASTLDGLAAHGTSGMPIGFPLAVLIVSARHTLHRRRRRGGGRYGSVDLETHVQCSKRLSTVCARRCGLQCGAATAWRVAQGRYHHPRLGVHQYVRISHVHGGHATDADVNYTGQDTSGGHSADLRSSEPDEFTSTLGRPPVEGGGGTPADAADGWWQCDVC